MTLRTLNYGNYGIFLIMGHAGFCPSTEGALKGGGVSSRGSGPALEWCLLRKLCSLPLSFCAKPQFLDFKFSGTESMFES